MRFQLLNEQRELIGPTRAFDGSILFLPRKITEKVLLQSCVVSFIYAIYACMVQIVSCGAYASPHGNWGGSTSIYIY